MDRQVNEPQNKNSMYVRNAARSDDNPINNEEEKESCRDQASPLLSEVLLLFPSLVQFGFHPLQCLQ
jgi:hypothetical protein